MITPQSKHEPKGAFITAASLMAKLYRIDFSVSTLLWGDDFEPKIIIPFLNNNL